VGVGCFCAGCWGGLEIGLLGAANLGVGFGSLGIGAGAETLRLLIRLLRLDFFCCCAAAFCLACSREFDTSGMILGIFGPRVLKNQ